MSNTGFDTKFYIRRKRTAYRLQFLAYLDGALSTNSVWTDKEDTNVDAVPTGADIAPLGFSFAGAAFLSDNLGVNGETITGFTIAVVCSRNDSANNDSIVYGLFGSTHYPRIFFTGTTLTAEVKLDGSVKTVTVANIDNYMKNGQPYMIVFRGSVSEGIEVLIDGVSVGSQSDTGTAFSVGSGDFKLAKDVNNSYFLSGEIRGIFVLAQKLTDEQLSTWRTMLAYEGYFDLWRDYFSKWSGSLSLTTGAQRVATTPYLATIIETA